MTESPERTPSRRKPKNHLFNEPLPPISAQSVDFNGQPYQIEMTAIQGFTGKGFSIAVDQEPFGVTKIYFPLCGTVFVVTSSDFFEIRGLLNPEVLKTDKMRVCFNQGPTLHIWANDYYPMSGSTVFPLIIPPEVKHATIWDPRIHGKTKPRFLVLTLKQMVTPW